MKIIGIDPGLRKTGWAIFDDNVYCNSGVINTDSGSTLSVRLLNIHLSLSDILKQYHSDDLIHAAVELIFVNKNYQSSMKLGSARSAIILSLMINNVCDIYDYSPNTIKNTISGFGHASKEQISNVIRHNINNSRRRSSDESDAISVALCHYYHIKN
jgi:crossover junction endodeoxyribonuclease RuvC